MNSRRRFAGQADFPLMGLGGNRESESGASGNGLAGEPGEAITERSTAEGHMLPSDLFGAPIAVYTRKQAIADGVLVDLMQPETVRAVREAGFKYPVAMTVGAFAATVCGIGQELPEGQDIDGRLWDVLWVLAQAVTSRRTSSDRVSFKVRVWDGNRHNDIALWSLCGPGDNGEPVITILLQGED